MVFEINQPIPDDGNDPFRKIFPNLEIVLNQVYRDIDAMVREELEKIFPREILQLWVESKTQIPGVHLNIDRKGNPPGQIVITVTLKFKDKLLKEEAFILDVLK